MKKYLALLLLVLISIVSFGQNKIQGNWTAYCVLEYIDRTSVAFCDFCSYDLSEGETKISFNKFDMLFDNDTVKIIFEHGTKKTNYQYNDENFTIEFKLNEKEYTFKILTVMGTPDAKKLILKDNNDRLILLEEKD